MWKLYLHFQCPYMLKYIYIHIHLGMFVCTCARVCANDCWEVLIRTACSLSCRVRLCLKKGLSSLAPCDNCLHVWRCLSLVYGFSNFGAYCMIHANVFSLIHIWLLLFCTTYLILYFLKMRINVIFFLIWFWFIYLKTYLCSSIGFVSDYLSSSESHTTWELSLNFGHVIFKQHKSIRKQYSCLCLSVLERQIYFIFAFCKFSWSLSLPL